MIEAVLVFPVERKLPGPEGQPPAEEIGRRHPKTVERAVAPARVEADSAAKIAAQVKPGFVEREAVAQRARTGQIVLPGVVIELQGSADFPAAQPFFESAETAVKSVGFHSEGFQFGTEFGRELGEAGPVFAAGAAVDQRAGHDDGDLVTAHDALALERAVGIAFEDPLGAEFGHGVIGPVAGGHVAERLGARGGKRRQRERRRQKKRFADIHFRFTPLFERQKIPAPRRRARKKKAGGPAGRWHSSPHGPTIANRASLS